ncbi:MAG: hypothetical protein E7635_03105 [Ruminococcaceae bacterium]|nr:hypothetical protein [Oscillospiraceae bacterium]
MTNIKGIGKICTIILIFRNFQTYSCSDCCSGCYSDFCSDCCSGCYSGFCSDCCSGSCSGCYP